MQIDLTQIANAVVALLAALITAYIIPWIKNRFDSDKLEDIKKWVNIAVRAAELLYPSLESEKFGDQKFNYVEKFLYDKGVKLNTSEVRALIESEVHDIKSKLQ